MRPIVLTILLVTAKPAAAEDFNGFYAGVNAGLISERGNRSSTTVTIPPGASSAESGLPPSALDAADRMSGREGRPNARTAPRR